MTGDESIEKMFIYASLRIFFIHKALTKHTCGIMNQLFSNGVIQKISIHCKDSTVKQKSYFYIPKESNNTWNDVYAEFCDLEENDYDSWQSILHQFEENNDLTTNLISDRMGWTRAKEILNDTRCEHLCWNSTMHHELIAPHFRHIEVLTTITSHQLYTLLKKSPKLHTLQLADATQLDYKSLEFVNDFSPQLKHLNIFKYGSLNNEGILRLHMQDLKSLCMVGTKYVDSSTFRWVVKHLPNMQFVFWQSE